MSRQGFCVNALARRVVRCLPAVVESTVRSEQALTMPNRRETGGFPVT